MKKILLFLSFLLMSIGVWGAIEVGDVLLLENFKGGSASTTFNAQAYSSTYSSLTLAIPSDLANISFSSGNACFRNTSASNMDTHHVWLNKGTSGYIEIHDISLSTVTKFQAHWAQNANVVVNFKYKFNGESSWSNGGSSTASSNADAISNVITVPRGKESVSIRLERNNNNTNQRIDKIKLVVIEVAQAETHTITFNACGRITEIEQTEPDEYISLPKENVFITDECSNNGWKFIGWTPNINSSDFTDVITEESINPLSDTTLYALYQINNNDNDYTDIDTLNRELTGVTSGSTTYTNWSNKSCNSTAIYAGQSAGSNDAIQMRTENSNSGIVTTQTGGTVSKLIIKWQESTSQGRTLSIYGKHTAYSSAEELYNNETKGDLLGELCINDAVSYISTLKIEDTYEYIGIRSQNKPLYIKSIVIIWGNDDYLYTTSPKCYDAGVSIAHWYADAVKFDIDDIGDSAQVILSSTKDTICQKVRQDDWSYKFDKVGLNNLKCTSLKLTTFKPNDTTCIRRYHIPIMISGTTNTLCDSCDVVVLSEGQLNVDKDTVSGDVTIYEGGRLKVDAGKNYSINSLTLRRENDSIPHLLNNGKITLAGDSNYFFEIRTDAADWRWMALPASHRVSDIRGHNGELVTFNYNGAEMFIKHYDGHGRAVNRRNGWAFTKSDSVFTSGQGFLFGVDLEGNRMKIYRFTFPNDSVNREKTSKTITGLRAWGCNDPNLAPNHKGWNLIGNPFADNDTTDIIDPIKTGELVKDTTVTPWNGKWVYREGSEASLRYAVIPITWREWTADEAAAGGYASELLDDYVLPPFTSFFVQIGGDASAIKTLTFKPVGANPINRIVARAPQYDEDEELFLRVRVGNRKTGCFISNKFTDEYEPGDDLESRYPIYQSIGGYKLLYSAINDSIIEHGVQVTAPQGTLYLDPKVDINKFEYIYAHYNDDWYDLKNGQTAEVNGTFIIQAKRKTKESTTSVENINLNLVIKYILDGNLYIKKNNKIYNILGDRMQ